MHEGGGTGMLPGETLVDYDLHMSDGSVIRGVRMTERSLDLCMRGGDTFKVGDIVVAGGQIAYATPGATQGRGDQGKGAGPWWK